EKGNIKQSTVTITTEGSLITDVNNVVATDGIGNEGAMTYTGEGTNKNEITGSGDLTIDGKVINSTGTAISQTSIEVTEGSEFTTSANDITTTDGIGNDGTLTFTGGTNTNEIIMSEGAEGKVIVEDDLTNQANITQKEIEITGGDFENVRTSSITAEKITVADGSKLITDAKDLDISDSITITGEETILNLKDEQAAEIATTITGKGNIVKEGEGTVTLSGDNDYTGTTTITDGAIEIGSADNISENTIYMDGGKLIINGNSEVTLGNEIIGTDHNDVNIEVTGADTTLDGEILGNENLVKTGSGILDLQMESNSYAGDTIINEGGIRGTTANINGKVSGTSTEDSTVEFYDEDDEVTLNEFDTEKFIGTFEKTGGATMIVTNNFKAINANITNGTFVINNDASMGGSGSAFEVTNTMKLTDSTLKGYGDITTGDLIIGKNASLAPGNSTTTFKVNGNLIFEDNGNYDVEFGQISETDGGHYNDNTTVTKKTTIGEDATITLNNLEGKYYVKETIDLINSGTLDEYEYKDENIEFNDNDAEGLRAGYDTRISTRIYVEDNTLKVELQRKASEYGIADFDKSQNEQEAANAIDAVSTGNGGDITLPLDVLEHFYYYEDPETGETNIPALKAALNDIAGVIHANSTMLTFTNAKIEHVYDKLKDRRDCPQHTCVNDRIWAEYYYNTYQVNENENSPKFETNVNGFLVGFDIISSNHWEVGEESSNEYSINGKEKATKGYKVNGKVTTNKWNLGLMAGYGTSELKQRKDKTTMNDINFGLYSGYENENWLLKGMLLGGYEQYTTDRTIGFMNRMANSEHSGYSAALDLEAGYKIGLTGTQARHQMYLKPFVGITGSYINNESYKETGAESLNLKIENYEAFNAQARLGIGINGRIKRLGWYAKAGIRRLLTDDYSAIEASLLDYQDQTKMRIRSAELDKFSYGGGVGADFVLSEDWTLFANGLASFAEKSTNYYGNVGLMYKFGCSKKGEKKDDSEALRKAAEEKLRRELQEKENALKAKERELQAAKEKEEQELRDAKAKERELQEKIQNYETKIVSEQEAQKMKEKTIKSIRMEGKPTFKFGTSELNNNGKESLKKVAKELENYPDADLLIEGHTDSVGPEDVNQRISEERAAAMATSLKKDYRVPNDISVIGKGEKEPIASNATKEGRAKNRRVEIILTTAE
ncbi:MAG: autotransporter domain-containing protein, partial [Elusimicrobia bacterium]|nr:autotransporter domain-containing protein [Elusimicrobiota bacterium]